MKFKFNDSMLLELALRELKISKDKFQIKCYNKLKLNEATYATTIVSECDKKYVDGNLYSKDRVYATPSAFIKTTQYGRIKEVEYKTKAINKGLRRTNEKR